MFCRNLVPHYPTGVTVKHEVRDIGQDGHRVRNHTITRITILIVTVLTFLTTVCSRAHRSRASKYKFISG